MKRIMLVAVCMVAAGLLTGCAPAVVVQNNSGFPVRAIVSSGGRAEVLSPSPGESSVTEVSEGAYGVYVVPDDEWIEYAKDTRKYLNDRLANPDSLTGEQLLDVIRRLKAVAVRIKQFESAAGTGSGCTGTVTGDGGGVVEISTAANGALVATCK